MSDPTGKICSMISYEAEAVRSWVQRNGSVYSDQLLAKHQVLARVLKGFATTDPQALRTQIVAAAADLETSIIMFRTALPIGAPSVDQPLARALDELAAGAGKLRKMPSDLERAAQLANEAGPCLQAGYAGIDKATTEINRLARQARA